MLAILLFFSFVFSNKGEKKPLNQTRVILTYAAPSVSHFLKKKNNLPLNE